MQNKGFKMSNEIFNSTNALECYVEFSENRRCSMFLLLTIGKETPGAV